MLVIFAVIIGGIITGRLLSSWRLVFVSRMITVIIWLLLFLLGLLGVAVCLVFGQLLRKYTFREEP